MWRRNCAEGSHVIIKAPPRWYKDYPDDEALLGKVSDTYRLLANKRKVSAF